MFFKRTRKTFHISTSRVYIAGRRSMLKRLSHALFPYTQRAAYRASRGSALMAL